MKGRAIAAVMAALLVGATASAFADGDAPVKAGVAVDALTPPGMVRVRVVAPASPTLPVRLVYRERAEKRPALLVDVWIGDSDAAARATLKRWRGHWSLEPAPAHGIGDAGFAAPGALAFCRHNIAISVRRVAGAADVEQLARSYVAAVDAAPTGSPRAAPATAIVPEPLRAGRGQPLRLSGSALAVEVSGRGPVAIRRTARGWRIRRTGPGRVALQVIAVDERLRVSR